jgi:hypothetical protein
MATKLTPGDRVRWGTSPGETHGKVVRKVKSKTRIKGHTAKPDKEHPQYLVESEKTGAPATHKPQQLKRG